MIPGGTRRRSRERGAILPLTAMVLVSLMVVAALVIDVGFGAKQTRELQLVADLVAVDVSRLFNGRTVAELQTAAETQAVESAARNGFAVTRTAANTFSSGDREMVMTIGLHGDDPYTLATEPADSFRAATATEQPNAVRIVVRNTQSYFFGGFTGRSSQRFERDAMASREPMARIGVGSVEVGLRQGLGGANASLYAQALNRTFEAAFGVSVIPPANQFNFSALSYQGLAAADVSIARLATNMGFASPEDLSNATVTTGRFFDATATTLEQGGNSVAATQVRAIRNSTAFDANQTMVLGSGPLQMQQGAGGEDGPAAAAAINALSLLIGAAQVVDGQNFASYSFNPGIPGVASVAVNSFLVEPIAWNVGRRGISAHTSQLRMQLTLSITGSALGIPNLTSPISLPILVEAANAVATLTGTDCAEPRPSSRAVVAVTTSAVRARVGLDNNVQTPSTADFHLGATVIAQTGLLSAALNLATNLAFYGLSTLTSNVTGNADVSVGGTSSSTLTFVNPFGDTGDWQRVNGGTQVGIGAQMASSFTISGVPVLGQTNLRNALGAVFNNLDQTLIAPLMSAYGITLGGADVIADNLTCTAPLLVE
jgi:uncharacterized membrane protein